MKSTVSKKPASSGAGVFFPPCVLFLCQKQLLMSARNLQRSPGCEADVISALPEGPLLWTTVNVVAVPQLQFHQIAWAGAPFAPLCAVYLLILESAWFQTALGKPPSFPARLVSLPCAWGNWGTERGSSWDMQVTLGRGSWRCPSSDLDSSAVHWAVLLPFQHGWKQTFQGEKLQEAQMGIRWFWVSNLQEGVGRNLTDAVRKTIWTQTSFLFGLGCLGCYLIAGSIMWQVVKLRFERIFRSLLSLCSQRKGSLFLLKWQQAPKQARSVYHLWMVIWRLKCFSCSCFC